MNNTIKELSDTVELMCSDNYSDRLKAEYYQLKIRYFKLNNMLIKWENNELNFKPKCNKELLYSQLKTMEDLLGILTVRAGVEGVIL